MHATAMLSPDSAHDDRSAVCPMLVWVEGSLHPGLAVQSITMEGAFDERAALIAPTRAPGSPSPAEDAALASLDGRCVAIGQPVGFEGGFGRILPLSCGRLSAIARELSPNADRFSFQIIEEWTLLLDGMVRGGVLRAQNPEPRAVDVLNHLNSEAGLGLEAGGLSAEALARPISLAGFGDVQARHLLDRLLEDGGLIVRRTMQHSAGGVIETRTLIERARARRISLKLGERVDGPWCAASLRSEPGGPGAVMLAVEASGRVIEGTFELIPAWEPGLELDEDEAYEPGWPGFDSLRDVFRLWVLNEDGAYSRAPWSAPAFDASALFEERFAAAPLPFGPALSQSDDGRSLGIQVQWSLDGGATWSAAAGSPKALADRAGVRLTADQLPPAWLAAVRLGDAKLRVTATLQSPLPLRLSRWAGNPFSGLVRSVIRHVGGRFAYRKVGPSSIHHVQVRAGLRQADEADDQAAMEEWAAWQAQREAADAGRVRMQMAGLLPGVMIGDRLDELAGFGWGAEPGRPAGVDPRAMLVKVEHDLATLKTRLTWRLH